MPRRGGQVTTKIPLTCTNDPYRLLFPWMVEEGSCWLHASADRNEVRWEQPGSMLNRVKAGKCIFPALNVRVGGESLGNHVVPSRP